MAAVYATVATGGNGLENGIPSYYKRYLMCLIRILNMTAGLRRAHFLFQTLVNKVLLFKL